MLNASVDNRPHCVDNLTAKDSGRKFCTYQRHIIRKHSFFSGKEKRNKIMNGRGKRPSLPPDCNTYENAFGYYGLLSEDWKITPQLLYKNIQALAHGVYMCEDAGGFGILLVIELGHDKKMMCRGCKRHIIFFTLSSSLFTCHLFALQRRA